MNLLRKLLGRIRPIGRPDFTAETLFLPEVPFKNIRSDFPLVDRARGVYIWDQHGRRMMDAMSGLFCVNAGYGRKDIAKAMYEQTLRLSYARIHSSRAHTPAVRLARRLLARAPKGLSRVFFCSGGSEAVDAAIKLCRQVMGIRGHRNRTAILYRQGAYHGATYGAMSVSSEESALRRPYEPVVPDMHEVCAVDCDRCPLGKSYPQCAVACVDEVEQAIRRIGPARIAAMIAEPLATNRRVAIPPPEYWPRLKEVLDRYGILLILDEVLTGMGRTGRWFAASHWNIRPDLLLLAKGITSGYAPLGAVLVHEHICDAFSEAPFEHSYTFMGHPVACAAGLVVTDILDDLISNAARRSEDLLSGLRDVAKSCPRIKAVNGLGMLVSVEIDRPGELLDPLRRFLSERGLFCFTFKERIMLAPPLCVDESHIRFIVETIRAGLSATHAGP